MKNIVAYPAIITLSLVGCFASEAIGQQSSREDFKEFCDAFQGRWVGKVTWVADWPGLGKRGETVTAYIEARYIEDGQGMLLKFFGGNGSATLLTAYDARAKQIKSTWVGSGGGVTHTVIQKQNGKWVEKGTGSLVDGRKEEFLSTHTFSDNGNRLTITGTGNVDGEANAPQHDVWRRVSK